MTREEARLTLQENFGLLSFEYPGRISEAIKIAIEVLSQPSLPFDLDEAAHKYADSEDPTCPCEECLIKTFKAGAEWMAGQGITVDGTFHHSCGYPSVIELKTCLRDYEGADVIVTIRKK